MRVVEICELSSPEIKEGMFAVPPQQGAPNANSPTKEKRINKTKKGLVI
jgi:hypothetical protein